MARDTTKLHPILQLKIEKLKELCKKNGIEIKIGECVRTVKEQDELYAKGRDSKGNKIGATVTNAKGSSYSSMHQWGVAFDFYLIEDVDGDGKTSDDAFNNKTRLFNKVGKLGKSIGLEWGGDWKSIVDLPHFQLPNWGSTTTKLKSLYGTPEKFMKTWDISVSIQSLQTKVKTITKNSNKSNIMWMQNQLNKVNVGLPKLIIDGDFGSKSSKYVLAVCSKKKWVPAKNGEKIGTKMIEYLRGLK